MWLWLLSISFPFFNTTYGANDQICFSNQKEHSELQNRLPTILKKLPTYMITENFLVNAVTELETTKDAVRFYFNASRGVEKPIEEKVKVCSTQDQIVLHFESGKEEIIKIKSDSEINVRNQINMNLTPKAQFDRVLAKISQKNNSSDSRTAKESGGVK